MMKKILILLCILSLNLTNAQNIDRDKEMRETISWINKQFRKHSINQFYVFKEVIFIKNEPFLLVVKSPGTCTEMDEIERIPIKKIKPIRFEKTLSPEIKYEMYFETKNGEEVIWYQSEDKTCGQIGDYTFLQLNETIENDDILNRLKNAFNYLMELYNNDGKEKF